MRKLKGVLLIDDDETTNFLNERLLGKMGLADKIRVFKNGKQAFDYLYNVSNHNYDITSQDYFQPELILLDINMPVMDGFEFLELYNRLNPEFRQGIILVVLTTSSQPEDTVRAEKHQAYYVTKPLNHEKVEELLSATLSRRNSA
jgi:CheY-like chemotaxis protein